MISIFPEMSVMLKLSEGHLECMKNSWRQKFSFERFCREGTTLLFMRKHDIHGSPKWPFCFVLVSPVLYIKMTITAL